MRSIFFYQHEFFSAPEAAHIILDQVALRYGRRDVMVHVGCPVGEAVRSISARPRAAGSST